MEVRHAVNLIKIRLGERWQVGFIITLVVLTQGFPNFLFIDTLWTIYKFARVPPKFLIFLAAKAQLALMHNLFSIAKQPIAFPLNLLKTLTLIILVMKELLD